MLIPIRRVLAATMLVAGSPSLAATYELPADGNDVVGEVQIVTASYEDTLIDLARRYGVGYQDIVRANPDVDVWVPGEGTEIVIPTRFVLPLVPRRGIVLNLAEYRLYYFPEPKGDEPAVVMTFPISIGRQDWETPIGVTKIVSKVVNPTWFPPQSVLDEHAADGRPLARIVPPGPNNPLGKHAMRLGLPGYLIHGTNRPAGVGMRVTHGCLRMFPEDIEYLFDFIAIDTPVRIINEPVKIGWDGELLVMEVHPVLESSPGQTSDVPLRDTAETADDAARNGDDGDIEQPVVAAADGIDTDANDNGDKNIAVEKDPLTYVTEQFVIATEERFGELDWLLVEAVVKRADGLPVVVGQSIKNAATSAASE